jgi:hypothetical protein
MVGHSHPTMPMWVPALRSLEKLKVIGCMLLCMLEAVEGMLCVLEVMGCVLLCISEGMEVQARYYLSLF